MTAEEVSVVKATMSYHGPPFALLPPPPAEDWDAGRLPAGAADHREMSLFPSEEEPRQEAPQREEMPEPQLVTVEEALDIANERMEMSGEQLRPEDVDGHVSGARHLNHKSNHQKRHMPLLSSHCVYPHACLSLLDSESEAVATYGGSEQSVDSETVGTG